jgi:hypothetical protein
LAAPYQKPFLCHVRSHLPSLATSHLQSPDKSHPQSPARILLLSLVMSHHLRLVRRLLQNPVRSRLHSQATRNLLVSLAQSLHPGLEPETTL